MLSVGVLLMDGVSMLAAWLVPIMVPNVFHRIAFLYRLIDESGTMRVASAMLLSLKVPVHVDGAFSALQITFSRF